MVDANAAVDLVMQTDLLVELVIIAGKLNAIHAGD